jgi:putative SOS response-associated peptidase YedK
MCAHYESVHSPQRLRQHFGVDLPSELARRDVWPGHLSTFIVGPDHGTPPLPAARQARLGVFGLIPAWAQDPKIARHTYNARSETVAAKPSFRDAWRQAQHCIVPAEAIFEPDWRSGKAVAQRIGRPDGRALGLAGLWSLWRDKLGTDLYSFTLLTINADAHPFMSQFHQPGEEKRMVVVLPPEHYDDWLQSGPEQALDFLRPCPADDLSLAPDAP